MLVPMFQAILQFLQAVDGTTAAAAVAAGLGISQARLEQEGHLLQVNQQTHKPQAALEEQEEEVLYV